MEIYIAFYSKHNFNILGHSVKEWEKPGLDALLPEGSFLVSDNLREIQRKSVLLMWPFLHDLAEKDEEYFTARIQQPDDSLVKKILKELNFPNLYFLNEADKIDFEKKFDVISIFPGKEKWKDISQKVSVAVAGPHFNYSSVY